MKGFDYSGVSEAGGWAGTLDSSLRCAPFGMTKDEGVALRMTENEGVAFRMTKDEGAAFRMTE